MWPFTSTQNPRPAESGSIATQANSLVEVSPAKLPESPNSSPDAPQDVAQLHITGWPNERLAVPVHFRAPMLMTAAFLAGFATGSSHGSSKAGGRFRAENAHRLPTTQKGWYLYHKSKNTHVMLGGMKEGFKFGGVCTVWATLFMATEEVVDRSRARIFARRDDETATGQRDAASTVIAAMTVAGLYSWKQGFDHFAAAGTARHALRYSLAYGLVQDAVATLRGTPPGYIQWLKNKVISSKHTQYAQG